MRDMDLTNPLPSIPLQSISALDAQVSLSLSSPYQAYFLPYLSSPERDTGAEYGSPPPIPRPGLSLSLSLFSLSIHPRSGLVPKFLSVSLLSLALSPL